jgi:hypothetical protein
MTMKKAKIVRKATKIVQVNYSRFPHLVIPAKAGTQVVYKLVKSIYFTCFSGATANTGIPKSRITYI